MNYKYISPLLASVMIVIAISAFLMLGYFAGVDERNCEPQPTAKSSTVVVDTLTIEHSKGSSTLTAKPETLRKCIFWIGDVVWPKWFENERGRKIYLGYTEGCESGSIDIGYLDRALPSLKRHCAADGITVKEKEVPE